MVLAGAVVLAAVAARQFLTDAGHATAAGPDGKPPIDPVAVNGPMFVDWPKPQFAIVFSGDLDGYLEPCGCAGLENQLGGLKRRHTFFKQLEEQGWPLVKLDLGELERRTGPQSEIKYRIAVESMVKMGYAAVGFGPRDVQQGADVLAYVTSNLPAGANPIVSANVGVYGLQESVQNGFTRTYRVIEFGGKRIGVTAVLGARYATTAGNVEELAYVAADRSPGARRPAACRRTLRRAGAARAWRPRGSR